MENSLLYHGARLYNMLPATLRSTSVSADTIITLDSFKTNLDNYLWRIPDQPGKPKDDQKRQAETNSLIHQLRYIQPTPAIPRNKKRKRCATSTRTNTGQSSMNAADKPFVSRWDEQPATNKWSFQPLRQHTW